MSRMPLDNETLTRIDKNLPDLNYIQDIVAIMDPDSLSVRFPHESPIPIASVCLQDTSDTLTEAQYALREYFAHGIWYREKQTPPDDHAATSFGRYYIDDTALRLYSAGEHLANAVVFMLEIKKDQLTPYRKRTTSHQSVVGKFLAKEMTNHPLTNHLSKLVNSQEWQQTSAYRNAWVHDQPPTVQGLGNVYERRIRWEKSEKGHEISVGSGDIPKYSVNDILNFVKPALFQFTDATSTVLMFYLELLKEQRIIVTPNEMKINSLFY